jgi:hypothetical protein
MKHATAVTLDQSVRNQMSLMAWVMAALCAWVLFLSTYACGVCAAPTHKATQAFSDCPADLSTSR